MFIKEYGHINIEMLNFILFNFLLESYKSVHVKLKSEFIATLIFSIIYK